MKIVPIAYEGATLHFREDGWLNATMIAAVFNKDPTAWIRQRETVEYICALAEYLGNGGFLTEIKKISELQSDSAASRTKLLTLAKKSGLVASKSGPAEHGGGTWFHPKLAVAFARWLDVEFSVWCDMQIDALLRGKTDWRKERFQAAASFKVMNDVLKLAREDDGKETAAYHYSNEARLINWLMSGKFAPLDRESLTSEDLQMLAHLEEKNAVLIGGSLNYEERKDILNRYAKSYRAKLIKAA
jgi:hypothetical protein